MNITQRLYRPAAVISGGLAAIACLWMLTGVIGVNAMLLTATGLPVSGNGAGLAMLAGMAAVMAGIRFIAAKQMFIALAPFLPFTFYFHTAPTFAALLYFTAAAAFAVFRLAASAPPSLKLRLPPYFYPVILGIFTAWFMAQGIWIYLEAWKRQAMLFPDWGLFSEIAWNTWQGDYFRSWWHGGANFMGDHFEPGFWLFFLPLIRLFPTPVTAIVCGAVLLWGSAWLIYFFARSRRLPPAASFVCALAWLLYPAISNMNLCYFYGFHPDFLFLPVFILFYWAWSAGRLRLSVVFFILSLSLKETNGVFWFGWGLCQLIGGNRKYGLIFGITGAVYFILCMKFIIPAFRLDEGSYQYLPDYAALGNSLREIMLSPVTRPEVFWGRILTFKNLLFVLALAVPVYIASFHRFQFLFSSAFILIFLSLRPNPDWINLHFWYQTETAGLMLVMAVIGLESVMRRERTAWSRILQCGLPARRSYLPPLMLALCTGSIVAHFFYAQSFYGRLNYNSIMKRPDCREVIRKLHEIIPEGADIAAGPETAAYFIIRNKVRPLNSGDCEWILYDLSEMGTTEELHSAWMNNPDYGLFWNFRHHHHHYFLFKRGHNPRR